MKIKKNFTIHISGWNCLKICLEQNPVKITNFKLGTVS